MAKGNLKVVSMAMVGLMFVLLTLSGSKAQTLPKSIVILDGRSATSTFAFATGMAELISKSTGIKTIPVGSTYGKNIILLHKKEADFAFTMNDRAYFAVRGLEDYKEHGKMNVFLLFSSSVSAPFTFVTRRDANIRSVTDLKGKKVMCIYPGNPAFTKGAEVHFEAVGMNRTNVQAISFSGHEEGDMALKERRISGYIHPMTVTSVVPFLQELNLEVPIRLVSAPKAELEALLPKYPYFQKDTLPAKVYGDITDNKDLVSIGVPDIVICQAALADDLVYKVMKAIFEHLGELEAYTPISRVWTSNPLASTVLPYHPGAIKYYKEKRLWTDELENKQKHLSIEAGASK